MDRIDELAAKLRELTSNDTRFETFGASEHHYKLNPVIDAHQLATFEAEYSVELPSGYRNFLLRIGNGGAGPYYGLYSLNEAVAEELNHKSRSFLATPFPLADSFNPYSETATDSEMFDDKYITGSLILSHQGCGYYDRLVITGPQRGTVWSDGRVSDQGIVALHCDFYDWYHSWLIESLADLRH